MATRGKSAHPTPDPAQAQCAAAFDKLLALSARGAAGELELKAASLLASDVAAELRAKLLRRGGA
jgi:hypothetical protein